MKSNQMKKYQEIKDALNIGDQEVSAWYNYKDRNSYNTTSKKKWVVNGIVNLIKLYESKFIIIPKKEARAVLNELEQLPVFPADLTEVQEDVLASINKQLSEE